MFSFFFIDHIYKFSIVSTVGLQKKWAGIISAKPKNEELSNIKQDIKSNGIQCVSVLALDP